MNGRKDDQGKAPLSLIPRSALLAEARVLAHGATKYGRDNWRGGMKWSRLLDAALRHITAYAAGEDVDNEEGGTGESHLANARCCLGFLIEYAEQGLGIDDRSKAPEPAPIDDGVRLVTLVGESGPSARWPAHFCALLENGRMLRMPYGVYVTAGTSVWAKLIEGAPLWLDYAADFDGGGDV